MFSEHRRAYGADCRHCARGVSPHVHTHRCRSSQPSTSRHGSRAPARAARDRPTRQLCRGNTRVPRSAPNGRQSPRTHPRPPRHANDRLSRLHLHSRAASRHRRDHRRAQHWAPAAQRRVPVRGRAARTHADEIPPLPPFDRHTRAWRHAPAALRTRLSPHRGSAAATALNSWHRTIILRTGNGSTRTGSGEAVCVSVRASALPGPPTEGFGPSPAHLLSRRDRRRRRQHPSRATRSLGVVDAQDECVADCDEPAAAL